jgi:cytochrome c peroxidase
MQLKFVALACTLLLVACEEKRPPDANSHTPPNSTAPVLRSELDITLNHIIQQHGLTGNPAQTPLPSIDSPKAQLGMKLFFSKTLSGNLDVACASCHHPLLGGGDNLSLSIGVDASDPDVLGHTRTLKGNKAPGVPRNAPTTFNIGLWKHVMFHDGRVGQVTAGITTPDIPYPQADPKAGDNLVHAQARFPVTSSAEMRGKNFDIGGTSQSCRDLLAARLGGYAPAPHPLQSAETAYWLTEFRKVYQSPDNSPKTLITEQNIAAALAEYQRSQVFVNTPWRDYVQGNLDAINETAKQGALLFFKKREDDGRDCASCHKGDFFTDEQFRNVLMPPIGPGKNTPDDGSQQDLGRSLVTNKPEDKFRFRTPSLLNVAVTGPWGHNGAYTTLSGVVQHMLNPFDAAVNYDAAQLKQPNVQTKQLQQNLREMLGENTDLAGQQYEEQDVRQLVAFLQTLTDPCVTNPICMAKWTPPPDQQDPMGLQLNAKLP